MFNWIDVRVKQEQNRDQLQQAEKERFIREVLGNRPHQIRLPGQALNWLLNRLVG